MKAEEFVNELNKAQDYMAQEKFQEAIVILEKLKDIDKKGEFDYNLIHRLYQLSSNSHSLFNQQIILKNIQELSSTHDSISTSKLNLILKEKGELQITDEILMREVELLILRGLLACRLEGNEIIF